MIGWQPLRDWSTEAFDAAILGLLILLCIIATAGWTP